MRDLVGKTAFVTGGASGIGFALGQAFAEAGMQVMLADIEANALAVAVENLRGLGLGVPGVGCDVTDPSSVEHAAEASYEAFGNVHVVCNNAGVAGGGGRRHLARYLAVGARRKPHGGPARGPDLPAAHPAPTAKAATLATPPQWQG